MIRNSEDRRNMITQQMPLYTVLRCSDGNANVPLLKTQDISKAEEFIRLRLKRPIDIEKPDGRIPEDNGNSTPYWNFADSPEFFVIETL